MATKASKYARNHLTCINGHDNSAFSTFVHEALGMALLDNSFQSQAVIIDNSRSNVFETVTTHELLLFFPEIVGIVLGIAKSSKKNGEETLSEIARTITLEKFYQAKEDYRLKHHQVYLPSSIVIDLTTWSGTPDEQDKLIKDYIHYCTEYGFLPYIPIVNGNEYREGFSVVENIIDGRKPVEEYLQTRMIYQVDEAKDKISAVHSLFNSGAKSILLQKDGTYVGMFQRVGMKEITEYMSSLSGDNQYLGFEKFMEIINTMTLKKCAIPLGKTNKLVVSDTIQDLQKKFIASKYSHLSLPVYKDQEFKGIFDYERFLADSFRVKFKEHAGNFFLKPTKQPKQKTSTSPKQSKIRE